MKRAALIVVASLAACMLFSIAPAAAGTVSIDHGGTYWGENVTVDRYQVIDGDLTVVGGDALIEGTVDGDVNVYGGHVEMLPGANITGEYHEFGGPYVAALAPWATAAGATSIMHENVRMLQSLAYGAIILLVFLIFPVRVRIALDRLERHPGLSAGVGTVALLAVIPVGVLLLVSIIGIPLIPLEIAAVFAGLFIGQAALGMLVGRRLFELIRPQTTPSPLAALVLGLIVIGAAQVVPFVGWFITMLVVLVGLGAGILAFIRESGVAAARAPISGPPMNPA
ncbi:MAG: hypothetical protein JOZ97_00315 [Candidatus Eremiobacteraeota bacterium]|nr:hypothetical protein [Candidatus Eremiobacteraeota bacterium]